MSVLSRSESFVKRLFGQTDHQHLFGKVAYVAYVDGDRNVHRVDLHRCACGATSWEETHVDTAVSVVTDADLRGTEDTPA